jgi:hypothetical protein
MPGFAKFLVFMNVLAAGGFLYLATLDFNARRPWAYEVFRGEIAAEGLPLDERDPGPRGVDMALWHDLDSATLKDMFAKAGGNPPKDGLQVEEVKAQQAKLKKELDKMEEDEKRDRLRSLALNLSYTLAERDKWNEKFKDRDAKPEDLQAEIFKEYFEKPLKGDDAADSGKDKPASRLTRRQMIAHLLYNLSDDQEQHQRVMVIIGLRNYINEAEGQAARLREMSLRTRMAMVNERGDFAEQYHRLVQRIYALLEELDSRNKFYEDKLALKNRTDELVKMREKDLKDLLAKVIEAERDIRTALEDQETLELQVFETQKKLGELQARTDEVQRYIRRMEGVGGRR